MNKLIILCKEDELKPIKDLIDKNFPDKDIQVYTDIKDVPEGVRDMIVSNGDCRVDMHFNDKNEFRKTVEHLMKELTEEQRTSIDKIIQEYQAREDIDLSESLKQVAEQYIKPTVEENYTQNYIQAEKERRKKDQKQQNKYALKYANKHYKK